MIESTIIFMSFMTGFMTGIVITLYFLWVMGALES
jgi:hypothetical protein